MYSINDPLEYSSDEESGLILNKQKVYNIVSNFLKTKNDILMNSNMQLNSDNYNICIRYYNKIIFSYVINLGYIINIKYNDIEKEITLEDKISYLIKNPQVSRFIDYSGLYCIYINNITKIYSKNILCVKYINNIAYYIYKYINSKIYIYKGDKSMYQLKHNSYKLIFF